MKKKKIEQMLEEMKRLKKNSLSDEMMEELRREQLVLPAVLPQDISPEAMKQIIAHQGKNLPLPPGVHPNPCIIQNNKGEHFLPLFTSVREMNQGKADFPFSLNISFDAGVKMAQKDPDIAGIVVNPFTHNLVMGLKKDSSKKAKQTEKITVEQYHALARRQMEAGYLPSQLFQKKESFIQTLLERKGEYLKEMYEELYQEEIACPYISDDFELMSLNISETLLVTQIFMPDKNRYPQLCHSVIFGFDREKNKIWYYAIVYEGRDKPSTLVRVTEEGEPKNLGEAPAEGSELTAVIERIQGEDA